MNFLKVKWDPEPDSKLRGKWDLPLFHEPNYTKYRGLHFSALNYV
jgi:hypothetical protein